MTPDVVYGFDDQDVEDTVRLLAQYQMGWLLVLHRRRELVGMVALGDLAVHAGTQPVTAEGLAQVSEPGKAERK
jgi:CBS-domain-containing membrane protein